MLFQSVSLSRALYEDRDQGWIDDAVANGAIVWWGGGNFLIDGIWVNIPAQYHSSAAGDSDGDLIPDDLDPYPNDPNNNTSYWPGGTFTVNDFATTYGAQYYAGAVTDTDGDGIPDALDPYPGDVFNGNSRFWWGGGTYMVNNALLTFPPQYYFGTGTMDSDGDGIPDAVDPYPSDGNNGNNAVFQWGGGSYVISNVLTNFAAGWFNGQWSDSDGDGIPDALDPFPSDPQNNTVWWGGGTFLIDGGYVTAPGQYHRGDAGDADADGIPDDLDPYPNDSANNTFWWAGGTFRIGSQY